MNILNKKFDIPLAIVSFLVAVLIWFGVIFFQSNVTQRIFTAVEVDILNFSELRESRYTILGTDIFYVDVTLEGKNSDLNRINSSEIQAYIDLSGVTGAGEISRPVQIRDMNYVTVAAQSLSSIILHIDRNTTKNVPVAGEIVRIATDAGTVTGDLIFTPEFVTVEGPEQTINLISHAWVGVDLGTALVERSRNLRESFILVDENGEEVRSRYLKHGENTVEVVVPVYKTKEVPLRVLYRYGYYNENNVNVKITPETITLRGSPDYLNDLDELIIDTINEKEIDRDITLKVPIQLPGDVRNLGGVTSADIEISFNNMALRTFTVSAARFRITPPEGFEYHIQERSLSVQFFGPATEIRSITGGAVLVSADLSGFTEAGIYTVPVSVIAAAEELSVFSIGEYSVTAEVY